MKGLTRFGIKVRPSKVKILTCIEKTNMVIPCIVTLMVRQVKWGGMLTIPNPKHLVVLTI